MKMQDRIDGYVRNTTKSARTSRTMWGNLFYMVTPAQHRRLIQKRGKLLAQANKDGFK